MPEVLLKHGLDKALSRYCNNISNSQSLTIQYDSWGEIKRYRDSFELSVYRIVQELLNNIVKHSKATHAIVQVNGQDNILSITIEDNGVGFNQDNGTGTGMGLGSLRSRVNAMNGKIEVEGEPGSGVSAYLEFETTGVEKEVLV
jgi:signal transduction histidine kinase